jgi:hypothetical protein
VRYSGGGGNPLSRRSFFSNFHLTYHHPGLNLKVVWTIRSGCGWLMPSGGLPAVLSTVAFAKVEASAEEGSLT